MLKKIHEKLDLLLERQLKIQDDIEQLKMRVLSMPVVTNDDESQFDDEQKLAFERFKK